MHLEGDMGRLNPPVKTISAHANTSPPPVFTRLLLPTTTMGIRDMYKCFGILLVASLGLFFGLFFGLNYPEIVRSGWPLTRCTVLSSSIATRYCCYSDCKSTTCQSAPFGSTSCNAAISSIQSTYNPTTCAANSTACPTQAGQPCDGGYKCCRTCCQTCKSCTTSCTTSGSCSQSCSSYSCNCYCCSSTNNLYCTLNCPVCYNVGMQIEYASRDGAVHNVSYTQDFSTDSGKANGFLNSHQANSTSFCFYNPKDNSQILFNVNFTTWKWVITAIFGMFPLLVMLSLFAFYLLCMPVWRIFKRGSKDMVSEARDSDGAAPKPTWRDRVRVPAPLRKFTMGKEKNGADDESGKEEVRDVEGGVDNPPPAYQS